MKGVLAASSSSKRGFFMGYMTFLPHKVEEGEMTLICRQIKVK